MKDNDEILAIAKESETDQQSPEFDGTNYDSMEDISFVKRDTTNNYWEIDKTISSEDAWECQIMRKKEAVKMTWSNRSPIWEFKEKTNDGFVQYIFCAKLLRSQNCTTAALIEHVLQNHREIKESAKLKRNNLMKVHT